MRLSDIFFPLLLFVIFVLSINPPNSFALPSDIETPTVNEVRLAMEVDSSPSTRNKLSLAKERYGRALKLFRNYLENRNQRILETLLGLATSVTELAPENPTYWVLLGRTYAASSTSGVSLILAEDAFKKALAIDRNSLEARLGIADTYMSDERYSKAIEQYESLLTFEPQRADGEIIAKLNMAYLADHKLQRGINFYRSFISQSGVDYPAVACALGILYLTEREYGEARRILKRVLDSRTTSSDYKKYAKDLLRAIEVEVLVAEGGL